MAVKRKYRFNEFWCAQESSLNETQTSKIEQDKEKKIIVSMFEEICSLSQQESR